MSISGISSPYDTQALDSVLQIPSTASTSTSGAVGDADGDAGQPKISKQAQFLNKLQQLAASDPAKFKQVVTDIAAKLSQAAQQSGQTAQGQALSGLAAKFQTVAQTGDLSTLQPTKPAAGAAQAAYGSASDPVALLQSLTGQQGATGHHHGHHHSGGSSATSSPSATSSSSASALASVSSQINRGVAAA